MYKRHGASRLAQLMLGVAISVAFFGGGSATAGTIDLTGSTLEFEAGSGEVNDISHYWGSDWVRISDSQEIELGTTLPSDLCAHRLSGGVPDPKTVDCSTEDLKKVQFTLGDKNDEMALGTSAAAEVLPTGVDAGSGDDWIVTGDSNDTLTGGSGNDLLQSAGGADTLDLHDGETDGRLLDGSFVFKNSCGTGVDTVNMDDIDGVMSDCESLTSYSTSTLSGGTTDTGSSSSSSAMDSSSSTAISPQSSSSTSTSTTNSSTSSSSTKTTTKRSPFKGGWFGYTKRWWQNPNKKAKKAGSRKVGKLIYMKITPTEKATIKTLTVKINGKTVAKASNVKLTSTQRKVITLKTTSYGRKLLNSKKFGKKRKTQVSVKAVAKKDAATYEGSRSVTITGVTKKK